MESIHCLLKIEQAWQCDTVSMRLYGHRFNTNIDVGIGIVGIVVHALHPGFVDHLRLYLPSWHQVMQIMGVMNTKGSYVRGQVT